MYRIYHYIIPLLFISFLTSGAQKVLAQADLLIDFGQARFTEWEETVNAYYQQDHHFLGNSAGIGLAYRIYPWDIRMALVPQLGFSVYRSAVNNNSIIAKYELLQLGLQLDLQVFPFDIYGDCNCPSFGRQNDFFQKAFYLRLLPGIAFQMKNAVMEEDINDTGLIFSLGAGAGLNVALNELITLAPELSYHYLFNEKWDDFGSNHEQSMEYDRSRARVFRFGLRVSFYFNQ